MPTALARAPEWHVLAGWGESVHGWSRVWRPRGADEVAALLARAADSGRQLAVRGAGRSYGDAALFARGDVVDMTAMDRVRSFDEDAGEIVVEAGATIETLWRRSLPRGYWPPVVPGTMRPTVGGCIAMNVHGKNHFAVGGIGEHVTALEWVSPRGEVRTIGPRRDGDLFRAVVGGFGLLGVITAARLRLKRVHSGRLRVAAVAVPTIDAMIEEFERRSAGSDYLVGWVDCFHPEGRAVLHDARYLGEGEDPAGARMFDAGAQELPARFLGVVPAGLVAAFMGAAAGPRWMRAVNAAKHAASRLRREHVFLHPHVRFAFLLDYVPDWKRIYRPGGLVQYQSFVPREHALRVHRELLGMCRARRIHPWLGVYKKHRPCGFLMTHALDGYSFAMDFPVTSENRDALWALCREMDEVVLAAGGRFYLAKDLTATPETLRRAYPNLDRFRAVRRDVDPRGVLTNDLAVRLGV